MAGAFNPLALSYSTVPARSAVRRSDEHMTEAVHSASVLASATAPGEREETVVRQVPERDPAFADGLCWRPGPDTHSTH